MISLQDAVSALLTQLREETGRHVLGIAGPPGAGKSTVAEALLAATTAAGIPTAIVGMDGWHLAHDVLVARGQEPVKGAPETFDAGGFVDTVRRIRHQTSATGSVWVPQFRREIENAVAGAIEVRADHRLVIVEGNYVLLEEEPWTELEQLFDSAWLLTPSDARRQERLVARHEHHGRDHAAALERTLGSDERNAQRVRTESRHTGVTEVDPG